MSDWSKVVAVVPGGSNTDLVAGPVKLVGPGELALGGRLMIGPGGKSRNVSQMMAAWLGPGRVAFLGRTLAAEKFGELDGRPAGAELDKYVYSLLAQVPMAALERAGVVTDFVRRVPFAGTAGGAAAILVNAEGENTIYVLPGVNAGFSPDDVEEAAEIFAAAGRTGRGVLPLALEIPPATALAAARLARRYGLKVILDPGGLSPGQECGELLQLVDVLKPNEHEAEMLTGVTVTDERSALEAGRILRDRYGLEQLVTTCGPRGVWVVDWQGARFQAALPLARVVDTTGCGDQFMAVLCAGLAEGLALDEVIAQAVRAAGLQAGRPGIQPVTRTEAGA
jgi:ribokinase